MKIIVREGFDAVDFERVHGWLTQVYWSPGVSREDVEKAAQGSALVVSAFLEGAQVGYLRGVSDKVTFGWVADVFVEPEARGKGVARAMLTFLLEHPDFKQLNRWMLGTSDAHGLYEKFGFSVVKPGVMMHRLDLEYQKLTGF